MRDQHPPQSIVRPTSGAAQERHSGGKTASVSELTQLPRNAPKAPSTRMRRSLGRCVVCCQRYPTHFGPFGVKAECPYSVS